MKHKNLLFALLITLLFVQPAAADHMADHLYRASAILYGQTRDGGMQMRCTATAFEETETGYNFVSAGHCVTDKAASAQRNEVVLDQTALYVSFEDGKNKVFHPATVTMAGWLSAGDDFAILHVETDADWTTIDISDVSAKQGELVVNVAAPKGLGKQVLFGFVSLVDLDRPILANGINWIGATLLQLPAGPGSSGSAVVSENEEAIIAFVIGSITGNPTSVAVPASKFLDFRQAVEDGEYEWFVLPEEDE